jgi:hypothetical protein
MILNLGNFLSLANALTLLFFFHSLSQLLISKLKISYSKNFFNIFFLFLNISILSLLFQLILILDFKFFYEQQNKIKIFILVVIYLNLIFFINKRKILILNDAYSLFRHKFWISTFLLIFFVCSLGIVSDADSLIYHSKISKTILSGFKINYFYDNLHFLLIGTPEIFNVLPEILNVSNFNTLTNFYFLTFFIKYINDDFDNKIYNKDLFLLLVISAPVISLILTPQKSFFGPLLIQFLSLCFILYNKKFLKIEYFIVIFSLIITITFKLNFILSSFLILIIILIKNKNKNKNFYKFFIKIGLITFFIYLFPHYVFKTIYFDNPFPPFLSQFLNNTPSNNMFQLFAEHLKEWRRNDIFFPFNLFLNYHDGSFHSIHNSLGVGLISFFFLKKIQSENIKFIMFFIIIIITLNVLFVQQTPRFYFLAYLVSLLVIFEAKINYQSHLKKIIFIQYMFTLLALIFLAPISIMTTFLDNSNNDYKKKFIFRFEAFKEINERIGDKNFIITDLPNYYSNNYEISTMILTYISNNEELDNFKEYLDSNNISHFFSVNFPIHEKVFRNKNGKIIENIFLKCFDEPIDQFSFYAANRKKLIFKSNEKITYFVYKKNNDCKFK